MSNMDTRSADFGYLSSSPQTFTEDEIIKLKGIKHENEDRPPEVPLQTPWTFWADKTVPGCLPDEFTNNLKEIYTVDTVQGFWAVFNNIQTPDDLRSRYSLHLMRNKSRPVWEDEINERGGTWRFKCYKQDTTRVWKELLLAAIGEQFVECMAEGDLICGITVTVRDKDDIIQIWNLMAEMAPRSTILRKIRELLPDVVFMKEFYKAHNTHEAFGGIMRQPYKR